MKRLLIILIIIFLTGHAFAEVKRGQSPIQKGDSPLSPVTITPPREYTAKKFVLFPLELPEFAMRVATWPLGILDRVAERAKFFDKVSGKLSNKKKTFWIYPVIEGGAGSRFGGGPAFTYINLFNKGYRLNGYYKIHVNLDQLIGATLSRQNQFELWGRPFDWNVSTKWMRLTSEDFYGIGPNSIKADKSTYLLNQTDIEGNLTYKFSKALGINFKLGYSIDTTGNPTYGGDPSVDVTFPANVIPGFGKWLGFMFAGLGFVHDSRDNISLPETGGLYSFGFTRYQHLGDGKYNFNQYNVDLRRFFKVGGPRRVFAVRNAWVFKQETGGSGIPFNRLATLDARSPLRSFNRLRFNDRNSILFNFEYRFPIWDAFDGVAFCDTGRVFHDVSDFSFRNFKYSAGGGVRIRAMGLLLFRVDVAYGNEGINALFGVTKSL